MPLEFELNVIFTFFQKKKKHSYIETMDEEFTDEQKKFLTQCEAEFSNRYTADDKDFAQVFLD